MVSCQGSIHTASANDRHTFWLGSHSSLQQRQGRLRKSGCQQSRLEQPRLVSQPFACCSRAEAVWHRTAGFNLQMASKTRRLQGTSCLACLRCGRSICSRPRDKVPFTMYAEWCDKASDELSCLVDDKTCCLAAIASNCSCALSLTRGCASMSVCFGVTPSP